MDSGSSWRWSLHCGQDTLNSHSVSPPTYFTLCNSQPHHSPVRTFGSERIKTIQNRFLSLSGIFNFFFSSFILPRVILSFFVPIQFYYGLLRFIEFIWKSLVSESQEKKSTKFHDVKRTPRHFWSSFFKIHKALFSRTHSWTRGLGIVNFNQ